MTDEQRFTYEGDVPGWTLPYMRALTERALEAVALWPAEKRQRFGQAVDLGLYQLVWDVGRTKIWYEWEGAVIAKISVSVE